VSCQSIHTRPPLAPRTKITPKLRPRVDARIDLAEEALPLLVAAPDPVVEVVVAPLERDPEADEIPTAPPAPVKFDTTSTC
jgi:hypothetical protein